MRFLMLIFGCISLYDAFTTQIGTADIMDGQMIVSVAFAAVILAIVGSTAFIWSPNFFEEAFLKTFLRFIWIIAFGYDLYTSYHGNLDVLMGGSVNEEQTTILIGLTILVSASPIIFSYMIKRD